ncbi:MAG: DUF1571 domain-containing protein [Singulisphaera sp.]
MISATDSALALKAPARRAWAFFVAALSLADLGCARLRSFQKDDPPPMLGTATPHRSGPDRHRAGDLYADRMAGASGRAGATLAQTVRTTAHPSVAELTDPAPSSPSGPVALEAPVTLPGARPDVEPPQSPATTTAESVLADSRARLEGLGNYQVWLNRQERVGKTLGTPEDVVLSIRRRPAAVRLEWPNGPHKRREVLYSAGENDGLMHVNMADSRLPVPRLSLPPDTPLVMHNTRHPNTPAGVATNLKKVEEAIKSEKAGDSAAGKVTYEGLEKAEQLDRPATRSCATPSGETWAVYIDPQSRLPVLVQAVDAKGELLERYVFSNPRYDLPELAQADAFDPNVRWGPPKGFFSRLAKANGTDNQDSAPSESR